MENHVDSSVDLAAGVVKIPCDDRSRGNQRKHSIVRVIETRKKSFTGKYEVENLHFTRDLLEARCKLIDERDNLYLRE